MYVCMSCLGTGSLACHGATRAWTELISCIRPSLSPWIGKSIHAQWPTGGQSLAYIDHICAHMSAVYHLTPPGDGEATPGDVTVQGAAPPGDTVSLGAARGWPLPPPCPGYRTCTHYTHSATSTCRSWGGNYRTLYQPNDGVPSRAGTHSYLLTLSS